MSMNPGEFERLKTQGTKVYYLHVCRRKLWWFAHHHGGRHRGFAMRPGSGAPALGNGTTLPNEPGQAAPARYGTRTQTIIRRSIGVSPLTSTRAGNARPTH